MESTLSTSEITIFFGTGILIMVALALVMVSYSNRAQRRILTQRMEAQSAELRHQQVLLQHNLLVQEEERQRIAAQLHDDIGSKLGVLHLTFHRLRRADAQDGQFDVMFNEINDLIAVTMDTTRRISHELLPPTLEDFGLIEALYEFCEGIRKTGAVGIQFEHTATRSDLADANIALHLFRIVQELTNNSLKYAHATQIGIQLLKEGNSLRLRYTDNGDGFDLANTPAKGMGLKNLQNRTKIIGATCQIHTAPNQGFEMEVIWEKPAPATPERV